MCINNQMMYNGLFTAHEMNRTGLNCNKSTQLHDAFTGHARRRHNLIGCRSTRTFDVRPVRALEFSLVHVLYTNL